MAYDEALAGRVRAKLEALGASFNEKKMFGGLAFMVGGNMCVGIIKDEMCMRLNPDDHNLVLESAHIRPFDFTGRPMKGWLMLKRSGIELDDELEAWIKTALAFVSTLPAK